MRVLVCGGRDFKNRALLNRVLGELHAETPISVLIEGGARGADHLAFEWASAGNRCGTESYPADWKTYGPSAGPRRNEKMLLDGKPDLVVAFPGGAGTADMVRRAHRAGVRAIEVPAGPHQGNPREDGNG